MRSRSLSAATLLLACTASFAQGASPASRNAGERTEAQTLPEYVSALRDFRRFSDEPVASWREANETVRRIGGWQAYSRESAQALRKPATEAPAKPAERDSHDAHHGARK